MALPPSNKAQEYVQQVCAQIRWKKAHPVVEEELLAHIEDQREAFLAEGMSAEDAEVQAVAEMGSPLETGSQFDRIYRPKMEWSIVLLVGVMLILGTVLRLTLLAAIGEEINLVRELWGIPVGLVLMMLGYWLDYTVLQANSISKALLLFLIYAGIYTTTTILLGGLELQGARVVYNYLAFIFPIAYCTVIYILRGQGGCGFVLGFLAILGSLVLVHEGTACAIFLVLGAEGATLLYALWKNWFNCSRWWIITFILTLFVPVVMILSRPYRMKRISVLFDPYQDPLGAGFMACQVLDTLHNATLFGGGAEAAGKLARYVAIWHDYLLTGALSYWGWSIIVLVLVSYALLLVGCFMAFRKIKSTFGRLVALSVISQWVIQILLYMMTNFTTLQIGTYPLLFVQGSAATTCNLFLLGLLLSVYKTGAVVKDEIAVQPKERTKINS